VTDWSWVDEEHWVPEGFIDTTRASPARIYDYLLGGKDNFAVDRNAADRAASIAPWARNGARACREYLISAVGLMAGHVDQFIDIGSGLPTATNVHDAVRAVKPDARVLYVDNDATTLAHARALLACDGSNGTGVVFGDLRRPDELLERIDHEWGHLIRLDEPVGLILSAILHFLTDADRAHQIVTGLVDRLPIGSCLMISHIVAGHDDKPSKELRTAAGVYTSNVSAPLVVRTPAEIDAFFDGLDMLEPLHQLAHDGQPMPVLGGIGIKRAPTPEDDEWVVEEAALNAVAADPSSQ